MEENLHNDNFVGTRKVYEIVITFFSFHDSDHMLEGR